MILAALLFLQHCQPYDHNCETERIFRQMEQARAAEARRPIDEREYRQRAAAMCADAIRSQLSSVRKLDAALSASLDPNTIDAKRWPALREAERSAQKAAKATQRTCFSK